MRWIGLTQFVLGGKTKRAVVELRDTEAQRTIDRLACAHLHRTSRTARTCAENWAARLNANQARP